MLKKPAKKKDIMGLVQPSVRKLKAYAIDETPFRIKLDAMENPFPLPDEVRQEIADACKVASLNRYPDPSATKLKEAISEFWGIGTQRMILGNGSDELIQAIIATFGGPVLIPTPTFSMYEIIATALSQDVVNVPLGKNFEMNADAVIKKAKESKAKVVFLACPNNPTGNRFREDAVLKVLNKTNAAVVIDEAYFSFSGKSFLPLLKDHPNMIILRTLSKIGFAGLRIGILTAAPRILDQLNKIRLPYNINTLSQVAAVAALRHPYVINRQISLLLSARERLYNALARIESIATYTSETNFILMRMPTDAGKIYEKLKESGILVKNVSKPGALKNCLRVTVGMPEENDAFIEALKKIMKVR